MKKADPNVLSIENEAVKREIGLLIIEKARVFD